MFAVLTQPEMKTRIEAKKHAILPKTKWTGEKIQSETLEIYEPGTRELKGYEGKLHTNFEPITKPEEDIQPIEPGKGIKGDIGKLQQNKNGDK